MKQIRAFENVMPCQPRNAGKITKHFINVINYVYNYTYKILYLKNIKQRKSTKSRKIYKKTFVLNIFCKDIKLKHGARKTPGVRNITKAAPTHAFKNNRGMNEFPEILGWDADDAVL